MNSAIAELSMVFMGLLIGFLHFTGLAFTVKWMEKVKNPVLWLIASFVFRLGLTLYLFYLILRLTSWKGLLIALAGFFVMRLLSVWFQSRPSKHVVDPEAKAKIDIINKK